MGIWSDIAGVGAGIAGFVAAPFTGGLSIPAGLSAADAIIGSGAIGDAADKQQQATDKALALQGQIYNQTRGDLSPYRQLGAGAAGNLATLIGLPPGTVMPAGAAAPAGSSGPVPTNATIRPGSTVAGLGLPTASNPMGTPQLAQASANNPIANQTQSGFVQMKAPTGEVGQVPANQVQHYLSQGATVIGGTA